jgi:hypothetical protein
MTLALHFACSTQFKELGPCHNIHIFNLKNKTTKSAQPLSVKGLGPILAFGPITSEDFKPLTQRIGPARPLGVKRLLVYYVFIFSVSNTNYHS